MTHEMSEEELRRKDTNQKVIGGIQRGVLQPIQETMTTVMLYRSCLMKLEKKDLEEHLQTMVTKVDLLVNYTFQATKHLNQQVHLNAGLVFLN